MLGAFLAGCTGSSTDPVCQGGGRHHFYPVDACFFFFSAPWFVVTDEELEAISQNQDSINDYVDEEGNLVFSRPEAYTTEEVLLLNGKTLETCRISAKEDLNEYSLETFASNMFDQMQEDMDEISLPQTWVLENIRGMPSAPFPGFDASL